MYLKSMYPQPPPIPNANVHECMFNLPGQDALPDYLLHIDALSGRKRTYYEFRDLVRDGATALATPPAQGGLGLDRQKDIVGIYSHNCMDYIALTNACLVLTTPFALLSAYGTPYELTHALRTSRSTCIFVEPSLLQNALIAAKEVGLPADRIFILQGNEGGRKSFQDLIDAVRVQNVPRVPVTPAHKHTLAYLVFSSGTSGLPKAVMISHGNIWSMLFAQAIMKAEEDKVTGATPPATPLVTLLLLPFYHTYGLHMANFKFFSSPNTFVILPKWDVNDVLKVIPKYRINMIPLIPSAIHQLANHPLIGKTDLSSIINIGSGAAYLPPALHDKFMKHLKNVPVLLEGYGMSEQTLSTCRKPYPGVFGQYPKEGSAGTLIPGVEARILRPDGSECEIDEPGELWVRGEHIALGYYGNEKATKETFINGWLRTGDHFRADKDGHLFFVDRAKDTLKVSGAQVSPTEVENALLAQPDKLISDVSVAGVSGGRTSDEKNPRAWIVLSEAGKRRGAQETIKVLDDWSKQMLSRYKWLRGGYEVVDTIPKSPTGKVLRRVLQDQYESRIAAQAKL